MKPGLAKSFSLPQVWLMVLHLAHELVRLKDADERTFNMATRRLCATVLAFEARRRLRA